MTLKRLLKTPSLLAGTVMLLLLVCAAFLAPYISPYDYTRQDLFAVLQPPSAVHLMGTDQLGRDVCTRLLYAARTDLKVMVLAEIVPFCTGIFLGMLAGYYGKWVDTVITFFTDIFIAFPFYLTVIIIAFVTGSGEHGIYITFMLVGWIVFAKVVKGLSSALCSEEWIAACKTIGLPGYRIIWGHLFVNVLPQAVIVLMTDMVSLLVTVVTLGFLGIGIAPPVPDWGTMISDGKTFIATSWWLSVMPGCAVVYTGIALSLIGDGLADIWRGK